MIDLNSLAPTQQDAIREDLERIGRPRLYDALDRGRDLSLSRTLVSGGSILFPHADPDVCGHQTAAAVHAALDTGAGRILVLGVLHAVSPELEAARIRVAGGSDPAVEEFWGIQGPGLSGREEWKNEFSLLGLLLLWQLETERRGIRGPELILRYPYLAGGKPERLPGITELEQIVREGTPVLVTTDPFHHGIGYGEPPETALEPDRGGLDLARRKIEEGVTILESGDYWGYNTHCVTAKSDGRDVGQVLRHLLGPLHGRLLDLTWCDTTELYQSPPPTWVAAALIEYQHERGPA